MPHPRQATYKHLEHAEPAEPGSVWQVGERRYIVRDDGRLCTYPGMGLLMLEPDLTDAKRLHVAPPP